MPISTEDSLRLYGAALKPRGSFLSRAFKNIWTAGGIAGLMALAWAEPFSGRVLARAVAAGLPAWLADFVLRPLIMAARGILIVESFGYMYHRFFQHLGIFTRLALVFRRNQMFHWIHHMVIYPIGRTYRQKLSYVASEEGIAWSWVAPAVIAAAAMLGTQGFTLGTTAFLASIGIYAKFVIDVTHSRFHENKHPWTGRPYFVWLEEIHLLHHWDQRFNFTIVHPAMDWLFGTYRAPARHRRELAAATDSEELTVSDLVNWRYLLIEANPAEYAAFITQARRHTRSLRKLAKLQEALLAASRALPGDAHLAELYRRSVQLEALVTPGSPVPTAA